MYILNIRRLLIYFAGFQVRNVRINERGSKGSASLNLAYISVEAVPNSLEYYFVVLADCSLSPIL
jgi:hypothetical protein